jgi:hypothetical protein
MASSSDNSHPPVITHPRKKSRIFQRVDDQQLFIPLVPSTLELSQNIKAAPLFHEKSKSEFKEPSTKPFDSTSVKGLREFGDFKMLYLEQVGIFPYGSLEKGVEALAGRKIKAQNVRSQFLNLSIFANNK